MKNKAFSKHKPLKLAAAALMSAVVFTVSATPAFAHTFLSIEKNEDFSADAKDMIHLDLSDSDIFIIDENGIMREGTLDPQIIPCNHSYKAIQISKHQKNSDGSCITTYYKGERCSKCAHIIMEEKIGTATYKVCPH